MTEREACARWLERQATEWEASITKVPKSIGPEYGAAVVRDARIYRRIAELLRDDTQGCGEASHGG